MSDSAISFSALTVLPEGMFPNGNLPAVVEVSTTGSNRSLAGFVSQINSLFRGSAAATLKLAEIVGTAKASLNPEEFVRLAERTKFSPGKFSKLLTIANRREDFETLIDRLPAGWTVLYRLATLQPDELVRLDAMGGIRPDLIIREIEEFLTLDRMKRKGEQTPQEEVVVEPDAFCVLATILVATQLPAEVGETVKALLLGALAGQPVHINFPEPIGKAERHHREQLAAQLHATLAAILASHCEARDSCTRSEYEAIESAAWQHQHKEQKGSYPYTPTDG